MAIRDSSATAKSFACNDGPVPVTKKIKDIPSGTVFRGKLFGLRVGTFVRAFNTIVRLDTPNAFVHTWGGVLNESVDGYVEAKAIDVRVTF